MIDGQKKNGCAYLCQFAISRVFIDLVQGYAGEMLIGVNVRFDRLRSKNENEPMSRLSLLHGSPTVMCMGARFIPVWVLS